MSDRSAAGWRAEGGKSRLARGADGMERIGAPSQDGLSAVLRDVNVRSVVYCLSDFTAPWGFRVEHSPVAKFHVLLHGTAVLTVGDTPPVRLKSGDLVLLPHGDGHAICDQPGSSMRPLDAILADYLPPVLTLDSAAGLVRWLEPLFALLREETQASAPGAAAIFAKLADVFLTQALRSYLTAADGLVRLGLPAMPDPDITRIVRMMRARPQARWSVDSMAQSAGMSRTSFNARFRAVVGEPPMTYLTQLRLTRGAGYLSATTKNVREVAHLVGYDNEASFSKAFSRLFGRPPGAYRRELIAAPQPPTR